MSKTKPLAVDYSQKDAALQILPRSPLLTNQQLGWDGILVQYHLQPAWETPEHCHADHIIAIRNLSYPTEFEGLLNKQMPSENIVHGEISIIPANLPHKDILPQETDFILFSLKPAHIAHIAHEFVDADDIELLPHLEMCNPVIYKIAQLFKSELESSGLGSRLYADSLTTALSVQLLRNYCSHERPLREYTDGLSKYKLQQVINYINDHLSEDLSLEAIASQLQMSVYYFARLFKQSMGVTPHQYVIMRRVEQAKYLLQQQQELSLSEVAFLVGFAHQSHLSYHCKRLLGVTPKEIRRK